MPNLGKAFMGAALGVKEAFNLSAEKRRLDLYEQQITQSKEAAEQERKLRLLKLQVDDRANQISEQRLKLDQGIFLNNILENVYQGRNDITENEYQGAIKLFGEKAQIDPETAKLFFAPIKDEKTGMIKGYSYNGQTAAEKLDNDKKKADIMLTKAQAAKEKIDAEIAKSGGAAKTIENLLVKTLQNDATFNALPQDQKNSLLSRLSHSLATATTVTKPLGSPTAATQTEIQKDIVNLYSDLSDLEEIGKNAMPEVFTAYGQLKRTALNFKDWLFRENLPENEKQYVGQARIFLEDLEKFFLRYKHAVTGAQAGYKEIEDIRKAVLNPKLKKAEFEYSFKKAFDAMKKALRIKQYMLREGTDLSDKDFGKKLDEIYTSPIDPTLTSEGINARGQEIYDLIKKNNKNMSYKQIMDIVDDQLTKEGYFVK